MAEAKEIETTSGPAGRLDELVMAIDEVRRSQKIRTPECPCEDLTRGVLHGVSKPRESNAMDTSYILGLLDAAELFFGEDFRASVLSKVKA